MLKLKASGSEMVTWFKENFMQANPNKLQYILFGASDEYHLQLTGDIVLNAVESVKFLGVDIDKELNIGAHIGRICK